MISDTFLMTVMDDGWINLKLSNDSWRLPNMQCWLSFKSHLIVAVVHYVCIM